MNAATDDEQDARDMARLAGGHDASLNDLMERHAERLFHYLLRSLQDESDAADLAQEMFVRVYQNARKFDSRQKFSTWLYSIASNLVRDRFRWRKRHPQVSMDAGNADTGNEFGESFPEEKPSPSETMLASERADAVRRAIAALPEELRLPLVLEEYQDRSRAEIAEILGLTVKAVETRIYRARQRLRASLAKWVESPV